MCSYPGKLGDRSSFFIRVGLEECEASKIPEFQAVTPRSRRAKAIEQKKNYEVKNLTLDNIIGPVSPAVPEVVTTPRILEPVHSECEPL